MSAQLKQLLEWFEMLPEAEKQLAITEILKRNPMVDLVLIGVAEELFLAMDAAESSHAGA